MSQQYDVVAIGELLIDFVRVNKDDRGYPTMAANPGGAPCNLLAALAKYGLKTAFLGKVGGDVFGALLKGTLHDIGVDTKGVVGDDSVFTTLAFVSLNKGDRFFSFARKPGADTCLRYDELDLSLIDNTKIFHFGTLSLTAEPSRAATQKAVEYARENGKIISFDPNYRDEVWNSLEDAKLYTSWGLSSANIVKISDDEIKTLIGCEVRNGVNKLFEDHNNIKMVIASLGKEGCILATRSCSVTVSCPKVAVKDTTGAGDILFGSALSRIVKLGKTVEELNLSELSDIGRFATAAASLSTEKNGGISSVPDERIVINKMKAVKVN